MLGVHPIAAPRFGGPRRSRAVYDALLPKVEALAYVAVHAKQSGIKVGAHDIGAGYETRDSIDARPYLADVLCGEAIRTDSGVRSRLKRFITAFRPDTIVVEQVYPWLGLESLLQELDTLPMLIYDAHNVEHQMKASMYGSFGLAVEEREAIVSRILDAERGIAASSSLTLAVSESDAAALRDMGAHQVVVAPNGTSRLTASASAVKAHVDDLRGRGVRSTFVFVSSAHQPNWDGFVEMVGTRMGFLPPDAAIVICGSVGDLIRGRVAADDVENATFWRRAINLGQVSDSRLAAAVVSANVMLLPITSGGGSNLKTAEALTSGRPIVATSFAFRGYEEYMPIAGVTIADSPEAFRAAMLASMREPAKPRSAAQSTAIEQLYWPARLQPALQSLGLT